MGRFAEFVKTKESLAPIGGITGSTPDDKTDDIAFATKLAGSKSRPKFSAWDGEFGDRPKRVTTKQVFGIK